MSNKVTTQLVIDGKNTAGAAFKAADRQLLNLDALAKKAGASIAAALSVGVIATWVKSSIDAADAAKKLAQGAGLTTKAFTGLEFAFSQSGLGRGEMAKAFGQLNRSMVQAAAGAGRPADAFKALGISVRNTAGAIRPADEVLSELADTFQQLPDGVEKSALAADLFGRNLGSKMIPLLNAGSQGIADLVAQAERLGLVISDEQAAKSEEFNDQLATLGKVSEGAGNTIARELLPTMTEMTGLLVDLSEDGESAKVVATALSYAMKALAIVMVIVGASFQRAGRLIGGVAAALAAAASGDVRAAVDIMRDVAAENEKLAKDMEDRIRKIATGGYAELGKEAANTRKVIEGANDGMADSTKSATEKMKDSYKGLSKVAKEEISKLIGAQREANGELEKLQKGRLEIDERYNKLRATLGGTAGGSPSYGQANALKVAARNALRAGDLETAKSQAQAAAKILEDLANAGESTYGLQGFANELQAIEAEANGIEQSTADAKLKAITAELEKLKGLADVKITVDMTPEELANAQGKMQALGELLSKSLVITPTITLGDVSSLGADTFTGAQQFATGGPVRGPGTGTSDSIPALLSNGEYVIRAAAVRKLGKGYLDLINNGIPLRRFADGGMVESVASMGAPGFPNLGSLTLDIGGQSTTIYADPSQALDLKRLATKLGRTKR